MTATINPNNNMPTTINYLTKPIMTEVKLCKRFDNLPQSEKEWFYEYKDFYIAQVLKNNKKLTLYKERQARKLFISEYNAQLQSRARREYEIAMIEYEKQMEIQRIFGFHAIRIKETSKCKIHCTNSYTNYSFSRPITKNEFISFLEKMGKEIIHQFNWWDDYTTITWQKDEWTYIHTKPYLRPLVEG